MTLFGPFNKSSWSWMKRPLSIRGTGLQQPSQRRSGTIRSFKA